MKIASTNMQVNLIARGDKSTWQHTCLNWHRGLIV